MARITATRAAALLALLAAIALALTFGAREAWADEGGAGDLAAGGLSTAASTTPLSQFTYSYDKSLGGMAITNYTGTSKSVVVPVKIKGKKVVSCTFYRKDLESLDVTKAVYLKVISCPYNKLTKLDLSKNKILTELYCPHNNLTKLDVSKNVKLTTLECYSNNLTKLNLAKNAKLTTLKCDGNKLAKLDLSKNKKLTDLGCASNKLTKLNVTKNAQLTSLNCSANKLATLNISKNKNLSVISISNNKLTAKTIKTLKKWGKAENHHLTI